MEYMSVIYVTMGEAACQCMVEAQWHAHGDFSPWFYNSTNNTSKA